MYVFISLLRTAESKQQLRLTDYIPSTKANMTINFGSLRLKYAPTLFQITNSMQAQQINLRNVLSTHSFSHFLHQNTFRSNTAIQISKSRFADYLKSPISINSANSLSLQNGNFIDYNTTSAVSREKNAYTNVSVEYCYFLRCTALGTIGSSYYGGAICGGALFVDAASDVSVYVCQFVNCSASSIGGTIFLNDISGKISLKECKIYNSSALIGAAIGIVNSQNGVTGEVDITYNLFEGCNALIVTSRTDDMSKNFKSVIHIYNLAKCSITTSGFSQNGPNASSTAFPLYGEVSIYGGACTVSNLCFYNRNSHSLKINTSIYYYSNATSSNDITYSSLSINDIPSSEYLLIKNINKVATYIKNTEAGTGCQLSAINTPAPTAVPERTPKTPTPSAPIPEPTLTPIVVTPGPTVMTPEETPASTPESAKATLSKKAKLGIGIGIPAFILLIVLIILIIWCVSRDTRTAFQPNDEEVDDELAFKNV